MLETSDAIPAFVDDEPTAPRRRAFSNRRSAGRLLGHAVLHERGRDTVVVGLGRGGMVIAAEVADVLAAPLDVWITRGLFAPFLDDAPFGAIAEGSRVFIDHESDAATATTLTASLVHRAADEIRDFARRYRGTRPRLDVRGKTVVIVDDGIVTSHLMHAAIGGVRKAGASRIVVAVPVASDAVIAELRPYVDDVICVLVLPDLKYLCDWYAKFPPVFDRQVVRLLRTAQPKAHDRGMLDPAAGGS